MASFDLQPLFNRWAAAWSSHDPEQLLALFTTDCIFEDVPFGVVACGQEELRAFASVAFAAVPDFKIELTRSFAAEKWAAIEWVMSGTHQGDFPGMPATGKCFSSVCGSSILELDSEKIRRESDYWDAASFMRQVGMLPS
ncbi:MAG: ester cyclase [Pirellulales bacterium]